MCRLAFTFLLGVLVGTTSMIIIGSFSKVFQPLCPQRVDVVEPVGKAASLISSSRDLEAIRRKFFQQKALGSK
jgi:hypothetical protein